MVELIWDVLAVAARSSWFLLLVQAVHQSQPGGQSLMDNRRLSRRARIFLISFFSGLSSCASALSFFTFVILFLCYGSMNVWPSSETTETYYSVLQNPAVLWLMHRSRIFSLSWTDGTSLRSLSLTLCLYFIIIHFLCWVTHFFFSVVFFLVIGSYFMLFYSNYVWFPAGDGRPGIKGCMFEATDGTKVPSARCFSKCHHRNPDVVSPTHSCSLQSWQLDFFVPRASCVCSTVCQW